MVRFKNRYVVCQVNVRDDVRKKERKASVAALKALNPIKLQEVVLHVVKRIHGDFGAASLRPGFKVCHYSGETGHIVFRCRLGPHKLALTALPFFTEFNEEPMAFETLRVYATLKHSYSFLKHRYGYEMEEKKVSIESALR